jgi:hypothetical protein
MSAAGWLLLFCLHGAPLAPENADLRSAQRAYDEGRYQEVLPLLKRARKASLPRAELERALELEALTDAAFDHAEPAIEAFRYILGADPAYLPTTSASPKLLGFFAEARRRGPLGVLPKLEPQVITQPLFPPDAGAAPPPVVQSDAFYTKWWFWTGLGVVAAGTAGGVWYAERPLVPNGSLGVGQMK